VTTRPQQGSFVPKGKTVIPVCISAVHKCPRRIGWSTGRGPRPTSVTTSQTRSASLPRYLSAKIHLSVSGLISVRSCIVRSILEPSCVGRLSGSYKATATERRGNPDDKTSGTYHLPSPARIDDAGGGACISPFALRPFCFISLGFTTILQLLCTCRPSSRKRGGGPLALGPHLRGGL